MCLEWERAAKLARAGNFTESQARKIVSDIAQRSGLGNVEFVSVEKHLLDWVKSKETTKAQGTAKRYRHTVETFLDFLGDRRSAVLESVRSADIEAFRNQQIKDGKSTATANMVVKTLRVPFNMARRQGLILSNPGEAVDLLQEDRQERNTFSRDQINDLLKVADSEWKGMILFGVCHGLRLGDVARLTWANINSERRSLIFQPKKTKGSRRKPEEYPLHPDINDYLASLEVKSSDPKSPIFPGLCDRKLTGSNGLSRIFRKLMHAAGIFTEGEAMERKKGKGRRFFELGFHSLRHTAISELANKGVAKEVRMKLSGHRSNVHERYTHHELETLRREVERVPSFLKYG